MGRLMDIWNAKADEWMRGWTFLGAWVNGQIDKWNRMS